MAEGAIEHHLAVDSTFSPGKDFVSAANVTRAEYQKIRETALQDVEGFWADKAQKLHWFQAWDKVLEWNPPYAKWFSGGKINAAYNCLDRIVEEGKGDKTAIVWEGEPGEVQRVTYSQLLMRVNRFANGLRSLGVRKGDRVIIYMPMIVEAAVAMLACARIGAVHSVIFGGFSSEAIKDRIEDAGAKVVVTADGGYRRGSVVQLKRNVDSAVNQCSGVSNVIVFQRTGEPIDWDSNRDIWWHDLVEEQSEQCQPEEMESEDMLFILYTSGTTGKPKGVVHTTGGYMVQTNYTARLVFDLKDTDIYWCTADVGWITGHSYIVYGLLSNGATVVMYEGSPDHPHKGRFWEIIDKHKVTILYTAPTAIRAFIKWGDDIINNYSLDSLRLLGTVGEPINPECWLWYHKVIGKERCPIVDTWWQTETGSIMISPVPGAIDTKPGSATLPLPGVDAAIVKEDGSECGVDEGGFLVIRSPWPSMLRGIYRDEERYRSQYWSRFPNLYFTGDGARKDVDGYFWIMGRVDDVINTAGHRLSTAEIESALVSHPKVAESACVGVPDEIKGEMVHAFVTLRTGECATEELTQELSDWVVEKIGAIARPKAVTITDALPKTRSGKIMRRLLKELASTGKAEGDVTTLEDKSVLDSLKPV